MRIVKVLWPKRWERKQQNHGSEVRSALRCRAAAELAEEIAGSEWSDEIFQIRLWGSVNEGRDIEQSDTDVVVIMKDGRGWFDNKRAIVRSEFQRLGEQMLQERFSEEEIAQIRFHVSITSRDMLDVMNNSYRVSIEQGKILWSKIDDDQEK